MLINPINSRPFYVGMSQNKDNTFSRMEYHLKYSYASDVKQNPHKARTIAKIKSAGMEPIAKIVQTELNLQEATDLEKSLIEEYGRRKDGGILTNIGKGGEGNSSLHVAVDQYNLFGEFIQSFESLLAAAAACGVKNSSSIVECCKHSGKSKSSYGFLWAYKGQAIDLDWCWQTIRPVSATFNDGTCKRFASASIAAKECIAVPQLITRACRSGKPHKDIIWRFL